MDLYPLLIFLHVLGGVALFAALGIEGGRSPAAPAGWRGRPGPNVGGSGEGGRSARPDRDGDDPHRRSVDDGAPVGP
jgi:hypothetical protein